MDPKIFTDMFALAIPVLEKIIRPIIVYVALIVGLRLAGKRELAQLNTFDLVVLLTLSNTVQNAIIGEDNTVTGGLIGAATLLVINYLVVRLVYRNGRIERLVEGAEDVLIDHGQVNHKLLEDNVISLSELTIAAHRQGFESLEDVDRAVLEPEGGISFSEKKPGSEIMRHQEILTRLDALTAQVAALQTQINARPGQQ
jgi:uncharacterized membrane protein YcaP (DUF421 family)